MNHSELYWKYENVYPFEIEEISKEPFRDFFANINQISETKSIAFYDNFGTLCADSGIDNFILPFVGANYNKTDGSVPKVLLVAESKYADISRQAEQYREAGRAFFNWVLNFMINGINTRPTGEVKHFVNEYRYTIFNQEPIVSYIKVRAAAIEGYDKMRYRDYRGWPFPFLIRAMNDVYGYEGDKKKAELNRLKQIAFVNYYQIPFIVESNNNGFTYQKFTSLVDDKVCTWKRYCRACEELLDAIIDILQPDIIIFASKNGISNYEGQNKDRIATIHHPASWFLKNEYNDREKLKEILKFYNN